MIDLFDLSFDLEFESLQYMCLNMIPFLINNKNFEKTFEFVCSHSRNEIQSLLKFLINFYVDHSNEITFKDKKNRLVNSILKKRKMNPILKRRKIFFNLELELLKMNLIMLMKLSLILINLI